MNKTSIILSAFFLLLIAEAFVSCCNCEFDQSESIKYDLCDIEIGYIDYTSIEPNTQVPDTLDAISLGLSVTLNFNEGICRNSTFGWLSTRAMAFSCYCPPQYKYDPVDSITSITIKASQAYDDNAPMGADLSSYFTQYTDGEYLSVQDAIKYEYSSRPESLVDESTVNLRLMKSPKNPSWYKFEIQIEFSSGKQLSAQSQDIYLR